MNSAWATPAYMTLQFTPPISFDWVRLLSPLARRQRSPPPITSVRYPTNRVWSDCAFVAACAPTTLTTESHLCRGGFPHSDICGSKLVCQLPAAFRRLPRPSSPVIAKASTTCTYSLDPIALHTDSLSTQHYRLSRACLT